MANTIRLKRGSGSDPSANDLVVGEIAIRTDSGKLFTKKDNGSVAEISGSGGIDDGDKGDITVSNGGDTFTIDSGVIDNANIASNAAIAGTKISPDFGSQAITTLGSITGGGLTSTSNININNDSPSVTFNDTNSENDFRLTNSHGTFVLFDNDAGATRMSCTSAGQFTFATNVDFSSGIDVTGDITGTGIQSFTKSSYAAPSSTNFFRVKFGDFGGTMNDVGIGQQSSQSLDFNCHPSGTFTFNFGTTGESLKIDDNGQLTLTSTDSTSNASPVLELYRNSASPADADYLGQIKFTGEDAADNKQVYAKITGKADDVTNTTEDGILEFMLTKAGSNNIAARFTSTDLKLINGTGLEVAGDLTASSDIKIDNINKSLQVGDITNDNYVDLRQISASSYKGFTFQHANASVLANLQGSTNQYLVLGDNDSGNGGTIFGIAQTQSGTDYNYLTLSAAGNLNISNNITLGGTVDGVNIATRDTLFGGLTSSSGVLTNGVTATTQSAGDNSTKVATTAYADTAIANLIDSSPSTLNTLNELASALGDDPNFATTVTNSIATKMPLAGGTFSGNLITRFIVPDNDSQRDLGTTSVRWRAAYVDNYYGSGANLTNLPSQTDNNFTNADHSKLDGIEANATADQTASEILTLLKTVDGAGSGLDADTLDGISSASFLRSDADDTITGNLTVSNTQPKISLVDTNNNDDFDIMNADGIFQIVDATNSTNRFRIDSNGTAKILGKTEIGNDLTRPSALDSDADAACRIGGGDVHLYVASLGQGGGYKVAMQAARSSDFASFTLNLQSNGGSLQRGGNTVWDAGTDGAGSGLDADLLDGVQGSSYLRSDTNDTLTGDLTLNGRLVANHGAAPATGANYFFSDDGSTTTIGTAATLRVANDGGNAAYSVFEAESGSGSIRLANDGKFYVTGEARFSNFVRTDISSTADGYMGEAFNAYFGLKHSDQTFNSEYMIISRDQDTFISASSGYKVRLRYGGNDSTNELQIGSGNDALTWRGNKVFHAGNDGSGSSLDADTVDGIQASSFLRSDADDTTSGQLRITYSNIYPLNIDSANNGKIVLQGSNDPYIRFRESATDKAYIQWNSNGFLEINNQETNEGLRIKTGNNGLVFTENGAEYKVFHAGNDGAGSGLDADNLDSLGAHQFLRSDAADTASGNLTFNGVVAATNDGSTPDKIGNYKICRVNGAISSIDNLDSFLFSKVDGSYTGGTKPSGAHNGVGIISMQTHTGDYFTQLALSTQTNDLFIRSANSSTSFGSWEKLWSEGNDGSGSGLDSDTVDGIQGASLLRSDTADTASGDITFSGGAGAITIAANSDIRFTNGTWSGDTTKIQHHSNYLYIVGGSSGIVFREGNVNRWIIDGDGHFDPAIDSTYDIGQSDRRVRNGYFDTLYGDGSNLTGISAGATGGGSDEVFYENDQTVTTNYTITNGKNAMAAGPITINSGVTVTVGSGENLTIV